MDLLKASRSVSPETETVLMTAYGTVENAVEAMKQGAYDFVTKPHQAGPPGARGGQGAGEAVPGAGEPLAARAAGRRRRSGRLIGQSLPWRRTMDIVMQAAPSMATVLLLGESGTGKELLARAIHEYSPRARGPFVPGQLRGAAREHPGGGAVRLREGRVHRARSSGTTAASCRPTAARCSWTRSARSPRTCR